MEHLLAAFGGRLDRIETKVDMILRRSENPAVHVKLSDQDVETEHGDDDVVTGSQDVPTVDEQPDAEASPDRATATQANSQVETPENLKLELRRQRAHDRAKQREGKDKDCGHEEQEHDGLAKSLDSELENTLRHQDSAQVHPEAAQVRPEAAQVHQGAAGQAHQEGGHAHHEQGPEQEVDHELHGDEQAHHSAGHAHQAVPLEVEHPVMADFVEQLATVVAQHEQVNTSEGTVAEDASDVSDEIIYLDDDVTQLEVNTQSEAAQDACGDALALTAQSEAVSQAHAQARDIISQAEEEAKEKLRHATRIEDQAKLQAMQQALKHAEHAEAAEERRAIEAKRQLELHALQLQSACQDAAKAAWQEHSRCLSSGGSDNGDLHTSTPVQEPKKVIEISDDEEQGTSPSSATSSALWDLPVKAEDVNEQGTSPSAAPPAPRDFAVESENVKKMLKGALSKNAHQKLMKRLSTFRGSPAEAMQMIADEVERHKRP